VRIAFQPAREYSGATGAVVEVAPSDVTIRTVAGAVMQAGLAHVIDGDGAWYVTTTDALYTTGTKYILWTTTTTSLGVVTEDHPFWHVTPMAGAAPLPPTVGDPVVSDTTAAFPNVPPVGDPNWDHTVITAVPVLGGTIVTGTGTGTTITLAGLDPSTTYFWFAQGVSATGATSGVALGVYGRFTTLAAAMPDLALTIKWWPNFETNYHEDAPKYLPILATDGDASVMVGSGIRAMAQARHLLFEIACDDPCAEELRGVQFRVKMRSGLPGGLQARVKV